MYRIIFDLSITLCFYNQFKPIHTSAIKGCEHQGHYGENCSKSCPAHCLDGLCHIIYGTCTGCTVGYKGKVCDEGKRYQNERFYDERNTSIYNFVSL